MKYKLIVIGVSKGGLHALQVILKELPGGFPLPITLSPYITAADSNKTSIDGREYQIGASEDSEKYPSSMRRW